MKKHFFLMLTSVLILAVSCKKSNTETPTPDQPLVLSPVLGYWTGTYNTTGLLGTSKYAMLIKPGGVVRVYDLDDKTDTSALSALSKPDGVWTLNGNIFQTTYKSGFKTVNTSATINAAFSNMTGTWAYEGPTKGNITLSK
jgi:hypothetical protein